MKIAFLSLLLTLTVTITTWAEDATPFVLTNIEKENCTVTEDTTDDLDAEIDMLDMECSGQGDYKVKISGGDLRYSLSLVYKNRTIRLTHFMRFHDVPSKFIEWLVEDGSPLALIHRINVANDEGRDTSYLIVSKLKGNSSCAVAQVEPKAGRNQNEYARELAHKAQTMPCL
ncbi:hypothetical protein [Pseudobdellovibrio exovorus]|uniref:Uncharacterized protein n=1 Tax=Pseudobdellovibrio exovorus JSS TaxID=1184267 RepID=M4VAC1_9BACT|nr:hypothetical protein [Pseudobdellovibrio exovorus]AGH95415.1 hypothetical protein A11Q_1199 [Pseudobdellovibrio exovorus JSS]